MDLISLNYNGDSASVLGNTSSDAVTASSNYTSSSSGLKTGKLTTGSNDETNVSSGGALMQKLSSLQSSDPEKFKKVAQNISDKLTEAAGKSSDSSTASSLSDLASKFASAASSGSLSALTSSSSASSSLQGYSQSGSGTSSAMESASSIISQALSGTESASA